MNFQIIVVKLLVKIVTLLLTISVSEKYTEEEMAVVVQTTLNDRDLLDAARFIKTVNQ